MGKGLRKLAAPELVPTGRVLFLCDGIVTVMAAAATCWQEW